MEHFDEQIAKGVDEFIESLFVAADPVLEQNLADSAAAGLPAINVSANQGKLLYLIARMTRAERILEIGTLGGYSTTWLGRALPAGGQATLVTLEMVPKHANVARRNLERAGLGSVVRIVEGNAVESLRQLVDGGEQPFDLIFIDADKPGYPVYLEWALRLSKPGTVILADNVIRNGRAVNPGEDDARAVGVQRYLDAVAANPDLESIVLPIIRDKLDGLAISLVKGQRV